MNVAEAAEMWETAKREEAEVKARLDASAATLKAWFEAHPKSRSYRGRIGFSIGSRLQLDTALVKAELGERLPDFQKRITFQSLTLLK